MIEAAEYDKYATREMDVLKAMRLGMHSWHFDVSQSTIQNCWLKSGLLSNITHIFKIVIKTKTKSRSNSGQLFDLRH